MISSNSFFEKTTSRAHARTRGLWGGIIICLFCSFQYSLFSSIPQIVVHWSTLTETGNAYLLKDRNGLPLDSGLPSNGDGTWAVLGFFDNGTVGDAFNGNWVALTEGTTVGDSSSGYGYDDGMFSFTTVFSKDSNQVSVYPNEPAGYSVNAPFTILDNVPPRDSLFAYAFTTGPPRTHRPDTIR